MQIFKVKNMQLLSSVSSSKGNQRKWLCGDMYAKEQFFYQGQFWKDHLVEVIASEIGKQLVSGADVLEQFPCEIIESNSIVYGCYSYNFCKSSERFISFKRLCNLNGIYIDPDWNYKERFENYLQIMNDVTGLNFTNYFYTMVLIDYLVGNEDRHLHNFGTLQSEDGFRIPPLFDFGLGLFEYDKLYLHQPLRTCLAMMSSKPFSVDNQQIMDYVLDRGAAVILPKELDFTNVELPSAKAGSYILNRCRNLKIQVKGID